MGCWWFSKNEHARGVDNRFGGYWLMGFVSINEYTRHGAKCSVIGFYCGSFLSERGGGGAIWVRCFHCVNKCYSDVIIIILCNQQWPNNYISIGYKYSRILHIYCYIVTKTVCFLTWILFEYIIPKGPYSRLRQITGIVHSAKTNETLREPSAREREGGGETDYVIKRMAERPFNQCF